jgi:hypothetical protein
MNEFFAGDLHDLTEQLAYQHWESRGRPLGSPDIDWFAAERALTASRRYSHANQDIFVSSIRLEADEGPYDRNHDQP